MSPERFYNRTYNRTPSIIDWTQVKQERYSVQKDHSHSRMIGAYYMFSGIWGKSKKNLLVSHFALEQQQLAISLVKRALQ